MLLALALIATIVGAIYLYDRLTRVYHEYKSILITGAAGGFGSTYAESYAKPGVFLALTDIPRLEQRLKEVAERCRAKGAQVETTLLDVTDKNTFTAWVEKIDDEHALDLVIANAGIADTLLPPQETSLDDCVRKVCAVNLDGVLNTVLPLVPRFVQRRRGQIAIMSSVASFFGSGVIPGYHVSKAAVRMLGESLYDLLAPYSVGVTTIYPGFVRTPMTSNIKPYMMPFLLEPDAAARIVMDAIAYKRQSVAFPLSMYILVRLFSCIPLPVRTFLRTTFVPEERSSPAPITVERILRSSSSNNNNMKKKQ